MAICIFFLTSFLSLAYSAIKQFILIWVHIIIACMCVMHYATQIANDTTPHHTISYTRKLMKEKKLCHNIANTYIWGVISYSNYLACMTPFFVVVMFTFTIFFLLSMCQFMRFLLRFVWVYIVHCIVVIHCLYIPQIIIEIIGFYCKRTHTLE